MARCCAWTAVPSLCLAVFYRAQSPAPSLGLAVKLRAQLCLTSGGTRCCCCLCLKIVLASVQTCLGADSVFPKFLVVMGPSFLVILASFNWSIFNFIAFLVFFLLGFNFGQADLSAIFLVFDNDLDSNICFLCSTFRGTKKDPISVWEDRLGVPLLFFVNILAGHSPSSLLPPTPLSGRGGHKWLPQLCHHGIPLLPPELVLQPLLFFSDFPLLLSHPCGWVR